VSLLLRLVEFLPLALVLGTTLAALRHEDGAALRREAVRTTGRILGWLVAGVALLHALLWFVQD
jgi:hypothetical protein